jgi:hypothetical protein
MGSLIFAGVPPWGTLALVTMICLVKPIIIQWMCARRPLASLRARTRWYMKHGYGSREAVEMARADARPPAADTSESDSKPVKPKIAGKLPSFVVGLSAKLG